MSKTVEHMLPTYLGLPHLQFLQVHRLDVRRGCLRMNWHKNHTFCICMCMHLTLYCASSLWRYILLQYKDSGKTLGRRLSRFSIKLACCPIVRACQLHFVITCLQYQMGEAREEATHKPQLLLHILSLSCFLYNIGIVSFLFASVYFNCQLNSPYMTSLWYI